MTTALPRIEAAGGTLIAVTPERPERAAETARDDGLAFPVAVDAGSRFARTLGLVFALPEDLRPLYREIGIDLPARNGDARNCRSRRPTCWTHRAGSPSPTSTPTSRSAPTRKPRWRPSNGSGETTAQGANTPPERPLPPHRRSCP